MLSSFPSIAMFPGKCQPFSFAVWFNCLTLLLSAMCSAQEPAADSTLRQLSGETMGTTYHITIDFGAQADIDSIDLAEIQQAIDERLADINRKMSTYDPTSEVSRFNQSRQTDWFAVSAETHLVVEEALQINKASNGAFDITVGPLVNAWGFGPRKKSETDPLPSDAEIQAILKYVGSSRLEVRSDPPAIRKSHPQVEIDLSAIAKGYGVDQIAELLMARGYDHHLVEIGGEVRAGMRKADGTPWRIGIEKPNYQLREISHIAQLENVSLASSGNYRNFFERDGKTFGHTIDPRTGMPAEAKILGASIVADNCMKADALATACMVLGVEKAKQLAHAQNSQALFFYSDNERIVATHTAGFPLAAADIETEATAGDPPKKANVFLPIFIAAIVVFLIAVFIMSLGTIIGNRRIKGSCGALASSIGRDMTSPCELCQKPVKDCPEKQAQTANKT